MTTKASLFFMLSCLFLFHNPSNAASLTTCNLDTIYNFGDSLSDTGNAIHENKALVTSKLPYGINLPGEPRGRFSDGLLIIDYEAEAAGLPFLKPYLDREAKDDHNGKNFAVSLLPYCHEVFLIKDKLSVILPEIMTNFTLHEQLDWMETYFNETRKDRREKLKRSLFILGSFASDYVFSIYLSFKPPEWVISNLVPDAIQVMKEAATVYDN